MRADSFTIFFVKLLFLSGILLIFAAIYRTKFPGYLQPSVALAIHYGSLLVLILLAIVAAFLIIDRFFPHYDDVGRGGSI